MKIIYSIVEAVELIKGKPLVLLENKSSTLCQWYLAENPSMNLRIGIAWANGLKRADIYNILRAQAEPYDVFADKVDHSILTSALATLVDNGFKNISGALELGNIKITFNI